MRRLAGVRAPVRGRTDLAEQEAQRRAVVYGLVGILISVMLVIGAIASLVVAFGWRLIPRPGPVLGSGRPAW